MLQTIDQPISPAALRQRIFQGEILLFPQHPAIIEFCQSVQVLCEQMLDTDLPTHSHLGIDRHNWLDQIFQFQQAAKAHPVCRTAFATFVEGLGLRLSNTFRDRFIFRVVPPQSDHSNGAHAFVDTHRDSWGAGIYQQINWWGALYDYPADTGIEFYPDYFDQPIVNNTADWSYEKYRDARQRQSQELKPDYKSVPSLLVQPSGTCFRPQIKPGDIIAFSSAHLHGSSDNVTDSCRFSFETRTVNRDDIHSGLRAPNVDNASNEQMLRLFTNMADGSRLSKQDFLQ